MKSLVIIILSYSVFTKLPTKKIFLTKGSSSWIVCEMKTPSDSSVYWTHKPVNKEVWEILTLNETFAESDYEVTPCICNNGAIVYKTEELIDDKYSMFRLELEVSYV